MEKGNEQGLARVVRCTDPFTAARPRKRLRDGDGPQGTGMQPHACGPIAPDPSLGKPAEGNPKRGASCGRLRNMRAFALKSLI